MLNYLVILIVLMGHLFSNEENRKKSVLLFQINDEIELIQDRMRRSDPLFIGSTDNISSSEITQ